MLIISHVNASFAKAISPCRKKECRAENLNACKLIKVSIPYPISNTA